MTTSLDPTPAHDAAHVLTEEERAVLDLWHYGTFRNRYEEISALTNAPGWAWKPWSRGRLHALVSRHRVRVNEQRIAERAANSKAERLAFAQELVNSTVTSDVLDFLAELPDGSANAIITSPPYNIGKRYGGRGTSDRMRHLYYHGWMLQVISEMSRVLAPGGTLVLQAGVTFDDDDEPVWLDTLFYPELRRAQLHAVNRIICVYDHGLFPRAKLAGRHETALVFAKGGAPQRFNINAGRQPAKHPGKRRFKGSRRGEISTHPLGAAPTDVWTFTAIKHNNPEKVDHPAQYPMEFARRCVLLYSMPGDLVCDPFSGSGTTQEACLRTGRAFVGADLSYESVRLRRLAAVVPDAVTQLRGVTTESLAVWEAEAHRRDVPAVPCSPEEDARMVLALFDGAA